MAFDPVTAALSIGNSLIERLWPDPVDQQKAQVELMKLAQAGDLGQLQVNAVEAKHESLFVAGWRPFIGWACGVAMVFNFMFIPIMSWVAITQGLPSGPPPLDLGEMMPVLLGMLGLGGLRTIEKRAGVNKNR